jgi:ribonuclease BN (tRNA processing enzyme)
VLDCGLGVTDQVVRAGIALPAIRNVFITHHHPDHNVEYGPLLLLAWIAGRKEPLGAYGPPPLALMTQKYLEMQNSTISTWVEDVGAAPFPIVNVHELTAGGPVMQDEQVKVTCAVVQHPPIKPAFGYRFDFRDRSIAFSGDTVALPAVAQLAKGADVLVHEVMDLAAIERIVRAQRPSGEGVDQLIEHMRRDHTPAIDVGRIAAEAGVKTLVLSHFVPPQPIVTDEMWRSEAAKAFKGEIIVAHDLLVV